MIKFTSAEIKAFTSKANFDEKVILRKDTSWPKISIVTPSYNQGRFLERTILSVLNQNYPNLEYIILDGGSTDESVEIIKRYEKYLAYWVSEKDAGQADAIKKGFRQSTGQILAWLNSDDVYLPGTLYRITGVFKNNPDVGVVYGNEYLTDEKDKIIGERRLTPYIPYSSKLGFLYGGFGIYQPASFWTRDLYYAVGEIDVSFQHCMDNDLFTKFAFAGARFRFVREFLAGFRIHPMSKTSTLQHVARQERQIIRDKCANRIGKSTALCYIGLNRTFRGIIHISQGDGFYLSAILARRNWAWMKSKVPSFARIRGTHEISIHSNPGSRDLPGVRNRHDSSEGQASHPQNPAYVGHRKTVILVRSNAIDPYPRTEKAARSLSESYDVKVLCWDRRREAKRVEARDGYAIHRCHLRADYGVGIRNIFKLPGWVTYQLIWLLVHKFDVVHAFDFDTYLPALLVAKIRRKRIVYDMCDFYADMLVHVPSFLKRLIRRTDLYLIQFADALVIADDERTKQIDGCRPKRLVTIYNSPPDYYATFFGNGHGPSKQDRFLLAYVGVLQKERGFDTFIDVVSKCPQVSAVIGGYGSAQYEEMLMAKTRGAANVRLLGRISPYEKTLEVLSKSDALFALYDPMVPNHKFSSPNKVFEAMMLGKPIIVTRNTSMDRLVEEHGCGLTVDYGNKEQLKDAILQLKETRDQGDNRYQENGRKAFLTCFHPDILKARLLTLYRDILCS